MINHIQLLRNVGQFDSISPGQGMIFRKLSLIYAENGRGKTTLANILRSLSTNNSTLITGRHRLGSRYTPHVIININHHPYTFEDDNWSKQFADIAIFDDYFVAQNVCSGIEIETGHKQNLHELILGAQGVELNKTLQTYIDKIEEHNRNLKVKAAAIPKAIRGSLTTDDFCNLPQIPNIEADIQEAERSLAAARAAEEIKQHAKFLLIELPAFDIDAINSTLQRDLPSLQAEAAANIQRHLTKLGQGAEAWISDGMQKIAVVSADEDVEICPFCAQGLQNSSIIRHYDSYFSESYANLKHTITEQKLAVSKTHRSDIQSAFERDVRLAVQHGDFWRKFLEVPAIEIDTAEIARAWKAAREPILSILNTKLASPLEKMSLTPEILTSVAIYNSHRENIVALSQELLKCNDQIDRTKEKAATANVETLRSDLDKLIMTQKRYSSDIAPLCQAYIDEKQAKKETEALRQGARADLDQYRANIFDTYEAAINIYLQKLNAAFRLTSINSQNHRSGSSCTYEVLINNMTVPLTATNGPSFKNTLSAGDRNTLALAFFFASLDQDPTLSEKIIVIDDPMTSLDEHRSLATIQVVNNLVNRVNQVLVLSHSKPFLCKMWEGADRTNRSAMKIIRSQQSSTIDTWDVHQDCITEHDKRHILIQEYIDSSNPDKEREVATSLRYVLEAFLRVAYPTIFPPGKLLGNFCNQCVQALQTNLPILSQEDINELQMITNYANHFHHDTNPAYATEIINDQELLDFCHRTLAFTKKG